MDSVQSISTNSLISWLNTPTGLGSGIGTLGQLPISNDSLLQTRHSLLLIQRLLDEFATNNSQTNTDGSSTDTPGNEQPEPLILAQLERELLLDRYAADASANLPAGSDVRLVDGENKDGRLSVGDTVSIFDAGGSQISQSVLTADDIYDLNFRKNLVNQATGLTDGGWSFDENIVSIKNNSLATPFTRSYVDSYGISGVEQVLEVNPYWEVVQRGNNRLLQQRLTDDSGREVTSATALRDLFDNRNDYAFDCASPMRALNLMATLNTVGEDDFNQNAGRLQISSWYDQHDDSRFDGGYLQEGRTADAGTINVNGVWNLSGELAAFDPAKGDELKLGSTYYFDKPGDLSTAYQGWNALYLGKNDDGEHQFWAPSLGFVPTKFADETWLPVSGEFQGYYLGAMVGSPDVDQLQSWDSDQSAIA